MKGVYISQVKRMRVGNINGQLIFYCQINAPKICGSAYLYQMHLYPQKRPLVDVLQNYTLVPFVHYSLKFKSRSNDHHNLYCNQCSNHIIYIFNTVLNFA